MDQAKTGRFIAVMRKEQNLTQRQLADLLQISDKTVSKWECGKGMPEVGTMLPLCETLHITVNELLTGERLDVAYREKAEENLGNLVREKEGEAVRTRQKVAVLAGASVLAVVLWAALIALGILRRDIGVIFAALSVSASILLVVCIAYRAVWLLPISLAGMLLCASLSVWSCLKVKKK